MGAVQQVNLNVFEMVPFHPIRNVRTMCVLKHACVPCHCERYSCRGHLKIPCLVASTCSSMAKEVTQCGCCQRNALQQTHEQVEAASLTLALSISCLRNRAVRTDLFSQLKQRYFTSKWTFASGLLLYCNSCPPYPGATLQQARAW